MAFGAAEARHLQRRGFAARIVAARALFHRRWRQVRRRRRRAVTEIALDVVALVVNEACTGGPGPFGRGRHLRLLEPLMARLALRHGRLGAFVALAACLVAV